MTTRYRSSAAESHRLSLQYLGGWGINSLLEDVTYRRMLSFRQPPLGIFFGSPDRVNAMLAAIREGR